MSTSGSLCARHWYLIGHPAEFHKMINALHNLRGFPTVTAI